MRHLAGAFRLILIAVLVHALWGQTGSNTVETVSGIGCVAAGVEGGCLVLRDAETKALYNLFFHGSRPAPGTPIQFTGNLNPNSGSYCMQGKIVQVTEWHRTGARCAPPSRDDQ